MADFFEVGKTYYEPGSEVRDGKRSTFEVVAVVTHPTQGTRHAFGWWTSVVFFPGVVSTTIDDDEWLNFSEDWATDD